VRAGGVFFAGEEVAVAPAEPRRQLEPRIVPGLDAAAQPPDGDDGAAAKVAAGEGEDVRRQRASRLGGQVRARGEQARVLAPRAQHAGGHEQLDSAVTDGFEQPPRQPRGCSVACIELLEHASAALIVYRTTVVGVDEAEVPQLRPLVRIGYSRSGELQHRLREGVEQAQVGHGAVELKKVVQKGTA